MSQMPKFWLTQHTGEEWVTSAMVLTPSGELRQHEPRHLGTGSTPQAALLRAITPLREAHPTPSEAADALHRIMLRRGISHKQAAIHLPVSADGLRSALSGYTESPDTYRAWAHALSISDADYTLNLRDLQRERDFS